MFVPLPRLAESQKHKTFSKFIVLDTTRLCRLSGGTLQGVHKEYMRDSYIIGRVPLQNECRDANQTHEACRGRSVAMVTDIVERRYAVLYHQPHQRSGPPKLITGTYMPNRRGLAGLLWLPFCTFPLGTYSCRSRYVACIVGGNHTCTPSTAIRFGRAVMRRDTELVS